MESRTKVFNVLLCAFFLFGASAVSIGLLIPVIEKEIGTSHDKIGLVLFAGTVVSFLSTFASGRLSDKASTRKIMIGGIFLLSFGFLSFGLLFGSWLNLVFFIFITIFLRSGWAMLDSVAHVYASRLFNKNRSAAFVKLDLFWQFGAMTTPLLVNAVLFLNLSPGWLFFLFFISFAILLILFYKICSEKDDIEIKEMEEEKKCFSKNTAGKSILDSIKNPIVIVASIGLFFNIGSLSGLLTWLTTYLIAFNIEVSMGSIVLFFYFLFSISGLFLVRKLLRKTNEITLLILGSLFATICTIIFNVVPVVYIKIIFIMLRGFFISGAFVLAITIAICENPKVAGTITGFSAASGVAGALIFHPAIGYVAEYVGENYVMYVVLIGSVLGLISAFILRKLISRKFRIVQY